MKAIRLPLAAMFLAHTTSIAGAGEAECKAITEALLLMTRRPVVRQIDTRPDFPGPIEIIFTLDAMYVSAGGPPKKMDVNVSTRLAQLEEILRAQPLRDCSRAEKTQVEGIETERFAYRQGSPSAIVDMQIWIGSADQLPYRWQGGPVMSTMQYVGVVLPLQ